VPDKRKIVLFVLLAFSSYETFMAVVSTLLKASSVPAVMLPSFFVSNSPLLGTIGWAGVGLVVLERQRKKRSKAKRLFAQMGLTGDVYDLMVGMRGRASRFLLLQSLETPRHRLELSEITGIDWKEVDRELSLLEKYGLVLVYAQSGRVKLYQTTE
jgi:hypothetical protein